jgi:hypothetical protein
MGQSKDGEVRPDHPSRHSATELRRLMQFGAIVTTKPAKDMIVQSGLPEKAAALDKIVVLEQACGTAPLAKLLLETDLLDDTAKSNLEITCADFAPNM